MHHANLILGGKESSFLEIPKEDREIGTDVLLYEYEHFGISEARRLKEEAALRPLARAYRTFIVSFNTITTEAQNALLKLFEDPESTVRFYVIAPQEDLLIPTLRSRLMLLRGSDTEVEVPEEAKQFLASSYADRLAMIAERTKEKDDAWVRTVLDGIEVVAEKADDRTAIQEVIFVRKYEKRRGASKKMLLEHLALALSVPKELS